MHFPAFLAQVGSLLALATLLGTICGTVAASPSERDDVVAARRALVGRGGEVDNILLRRQPAPALAMRADSYLPAQHRARHLADVAPPPQQKKHRRADSSSVDPATLPTSPPPTSASPTVAAGNNNAAAAQGSSTTPAGTMTQRVPFPDRVSPSAAVAAASSAAVTTSASTSGAHKHIVGTGSAGWSTALVVAGGTALFQLLMLVLV
ncbi:hypothetical protein JCM10908_004953 [Rhodotorula pacifica]|uniref:uncharacterized protein n=1 Tax=Rhodotorula pacifica TaxID=1495444 RepID=UPI003175C125